MELNLPVRERLMACENLFFRYRTIVVALASLLPDIWMVVSAFMTIPVCSRRFRMRTMRQLLG